MKCLPFFAIVFCFPILAFTQSVIGWLEKAPMPEPVTNNAVALANANGLPHVYSFAGMDSTKSCNGDHLRSFRYDIAADEWESIPSLPDPLGGKIAAGASTVKNKIYIIGGYHLSPNCGETSSSKVHVYDPESNAYLPNGADLPKAIDDHVQAVWRDSLIYVITGWSNTNNVFDVQIYNPATDEWLNGTSIPAQPGWRAFGASGVIIEDTIYFAGGAGNWNGSNFPPLDYLRIGYINPDDPTDITWLPAQQMPEANGYRMGAASWRDFPIWLGGSDVTYNFDGIAYDGSGEVPALSRITFYDPATGTMQQIFDSIPPVMDLRGVAKADLNEYIIAGGIGPDQEVSNRTISVVIDAFTATHELDPDSFEIFPNPAHAVFYIKGREDGWLRLFDHLGRVLLSQTFEEPEPIAVDNLVPGIYYVEIVRKNGRSMIRKLLIR